MLHHTLEKRRVLCLPKPSLKHKRSYSSSIAQTFTGFALSRPPPRRPIITITPPRPEKFSGGGSSVVKFAAMQPQLPSP